MLTPMTPPQPSDGVELETEAELDERRRLQCQSDRVEAALTLACKEYDSNLDGVESGYAIDDDDGELDVALTVSVRASGETAREVLQELRARGVGTGLLATYALAALCDLEEEGAS